MADQVKMIEGLAPGDFAVIAKNWVGMTEPLTAPDFLRLLQQEAEVKRFGKSKMGF